LEQIGQKYNAPLSVIHRGDLQRILLEGVYAEKVDVRLDHKVIKADSSFEARVQVASGEWFEGDVVIAADGIKATFVLKWPQSTASKTAASPLAAPPTVSSYLEERYKETIGLWSC